MARRRSRRSGDRRSTTAVVPRSRASDLSRWSPAALERPHLDDYPVHLAAFDTPEVLGSLFPVQDIQYTARRAPVLLSPSPYRHAPEGRFGRRLSGLASRVLRVTAPKKVLFCVSRKTRRQVLFAKGRAGFSGSVKKRFFRRDSSSQYRC